MAKKKVTNLIQGKTEQIGYQDLQELKYEYLHLLQTNPFPSPPPKPTSIDIIRFLKRKDANSAGRIGPYEYITVFEAANTIASDLVLINGILQLIDEGIARQDEKITLHLGTKHIKGMGDFLIGDKHGEAFNVAESFYSFKLQKTLSKWKDKALAYILVNYEVFDQQRSKALEHSAGTRIIGVKNWDIINTE